MNGEIKWTVENMKTINERLRAAGMPEFIIDEKNRKVYKDELHQFLGIGVSLEEES